MFNIKIRDHSDILALFSLKEWRHLDDNVADHKQDQDQTVKLELSFAVLALHLQFFDCLLVSRDVLGFLFSCLS